MTIDLRVPENVPEVQILDVTPRHETSRLRSGRSEVVEIIAITAAFLAIWISDASPAGIDVVDAFYRASFAGLVVWFASRARRWTWGTLAAGAALSAASLAAQLLSLVAIALLVHAWHKNQRRPRTGAAIAWCALPALMTQGVGPLWRLTGGVLEDPFGTSALITLAVTIPVFRTGWRTISRRRRQSLRTYALRAGLAVGALIGISGIISLLALPPMLRGLEQTQIAADSATSGDLVDATEHFDVATNEWKRANRIVAGPWMLPGRLIPIAGQNIRAAQVITGQASALTDAARSVTERADPDAFVVDGAVNVSAIDEISPAFDALAATVERASVRTAATTTPWLLPPIAERVDRANEVLQPAAGVLGASSEALHVGRSLLGGDETSHILIMFTTPAEARGLGGFVGSWALVTAEQGRLEIDQYYRSNELNALLDANGGSLNADPDYTSRYGRFAVESHIQDVTLSPDFPSVAPVAADLFAQATGHDVDAVVSLDPFVLEQLIGFSGPIRSEDFRVTGANASQELLVDQYVRFEGDEAGREAALLELTDQLTTSLFEIPPAPLAFVSELAPLADQDRINLWLANDFDGSVASRLGLSGAFPEAPDDLFAIVHQNAGQNKIDTFLERSVDLNTHLDPDAGTVRHNVTVTLDNTAPSAGLPPAILESNDQGLVAGTNRMTMSVYSPHRLLDARLNGERAAVETSTEFGLLVYSFALDLEAGEFATLDLELIGELRDEETYSMTVASQPLATSDPLSWHLQTTDGSRVIGPADWSSDADGVRWSSVVDRDKFLEFTFDR